MSTRESDFMTQPFVHISDLEWEQVAVGVKRKIMSYDKDMMMVRVSFETGGIGAIHRHPHVQMTTVESGVFEIEIDGVKKILKSGDVFYVHSNLWHGAVCVEKGVLLDMFSPMREDFVNQ